MPDRYFTPKRATYLLIFETVLVVFLLAGLTVLKGRVDELTSDERRALQCDATVAINDVSIEIPLMNLTDLLENADMTEAERVDREAAKRRYEAAQAALAPLLKECVR